MDEYSAKISLYEECSRLLSELDANNQVTIGIVADMVKINSYSEKTIDELIRVGAATIGNDGNLCRTADTHTLNIQGYFQERISELKKHRENEELNRRSVISAETSAQAAQESAKSARIANCLSAVAIVMSLFSLSDELTKRCFEKLEEMGLIEITSVGIKVNECDYVKYGER